MLFSSESRVMQLVLILELHRPECQSWYLIDLIRVNVTKFHRRFAASGTVRSCHQVSQLSEETVYLFPLCKGGTGCPNSGSCPTANQQNLALLAHVFFQFQVEYNLLLLSNMLRPWRPSFKTSKVTCKNSSSVKRIWDLIEILAWSRKDI